MAKTGESSSNKAENSEILAVELQPDFNPSLLTVNAIIQILSKWDCDLPLKREKKDFYVQLLLDNLDYIRKRAEKEHEKNQKISTPRKISSKISTPRKVSTPSIEKVPAKQQQQESSKKRSLRSIDQNALEANQQSDEATLILPSGNESDKLTLNETDNKKASTYFSTENSFQSPAKPATLKFSSSSATRPDKQGNIPISFSPSSVRFDAPVVDQQHHTPKTTSRKTKTSEKSAEKQIPKSIEPINTVTTVDPNKVIATPVKPKSPSSKQATPFATISPKQHSQLQDSKLSIQERLLKRTRQKQKAKIGFIVRICMGLLSIAALVFAHWYRVDYPLLEYCSSTSNQSLSARFYTFLPSCVPCPPLSICSKRKVTGCTSLQETFTKSTLQRIVPSFLLFFPLDQPVCSHDTAKLAQETKKTRQTQHLIKVLDQLVCEYVGKMECMNRAQVPSFILSTKQPHKIVGMPISSAKTELKTLVGKKWDDATFEEYWGYVMDKVSQTETPLYMVVQEKHQYRLFASIHPPIITLSCSIKKVVWEWVVTHSMYLIVGGFCLIGSVGLNALYQRRLMEQRVFASLLEDIVVSIHEETENYHRDPARHSIPGLSISQLKDHFLPPPVSFSLFTANTAPPSSSSDEKTSSNQLQDQSGQEYSLDNHSRRVWYVVEPSRSRIWNLVCTHVKKNANIRESQAQIKGESHLVWMWIGSSALSPLKKRRIDN